MDPTTIALIASAASITLHAIQLIARKWFPGVPAMPTVPLMPVPATPSTPTLLAALEQKFVDVLQSHGNDALTTVLKAVAVPALEQLLMNLKAPPKAP